MWDRYINRIIDNYINNNNVKILDAGCGLGIYGITTRLRNYKKNNLYIEGLDIYEPFLQITKKHHIYDKVQYEDVSKTLFHKDKEFDLALGIGVLTHLKRADGKFFKAQLERVSKHVILTAPTTLNPHHTSLQNDYLIKPLKHQSVWNYTDFKNYNIRGFHRRGSAGGSLLDTWLYPPLYSLTAIDPIFTKLTQYLVAWK